MMEERLIFLLNFNGRVALGYLLTGEVCCQDVQKVLSFFLS